MEITRIFVSGFVATSAMTAFSYIVSNIRNKQFREPELLNKLLSKSNFFRLELSKTSIAGWILHYIIGWIFVVLFELIWNIELIPLSVLSGILLGFAAGIIGVLGWQIMFSLNKNVKKIKWSEYYFQLIIAHIIFGICAVGIYLIW
ncbi:hypothetical protein [Gillisia marina]|uniref:hypothetical protein n=1 Tax=Gillisia marina TaxID=1167637 RepID=UPI00029A5F16|nr:hypothetical protein [Gillisia marina]